jgi:tetratricopeptide (TPR) repeat protein
LIRQSTSFQIILIVTIHKGKALSALGRHEEAIALYDKAIELGVADQEAYICKSDALTEIGRIDDAIECWEIAYEFGAYYEERVERKQGI